MHNHITCLCKSIEQQKDMITWLGNGLVIKNNYGYLDSKGQNVILYLLFWISQSHLKENIFWECK